MESGTFNWCTGDGHATLQQLLDNDPEPIAETYFKWTFVRHPWTRLCSAWCGAYYSLHQALNPAEDSRLLFGGHNSPLQDGGVPHAFGLLSDFTNTPEGELPPAHPTESGAYVFANSEAKDIREILSDHGFMLKSDVLDISGEPLKEDFISWLEAAYNNGTKEVELSDNAGHTGVKSLKRCFLEPMSSMVTFKGNFAMDYVGKFESLDRDWESISRHFNNGEPVPLPKLNQAEAKFGAKPDYHKLFGDPDIKQMVYELYEEDYKIFAYHID